MIFSLTFSLTLVAELMSNAATYWIFAELHRAQNYEGLTILPAFYFSFSPKHTLNSTLVFKLDERCSAYYFQICKDAAYF